MRVERLQPCRHQHREIGRGDPREGCAVGLDELERARDEVRLRQLVGLLDEALAHDQEGRGGAAGDAGPPELGADVDLEVTDARRLSEA